MVKDTTEVLRKGRGERLRTVRCVGSHFRYGDASERIRKTGGKEEKVEDT